MGTTINQEEAGSLGKQKKRILELGTPAGERDLCIAQWRWHEWAFVLLGAEGLCVSVWYGISLTRSVFYI